MVGGYEAWYHAIRIYLNKYGLTSVRIYICIAGHMLICCIKHCSFVVLQEGYHTYRDWRRTFWKKTPPRLYVCGTISRSPHSWIHGWARYSKNMHLNISYNNVFKLLVKLIEGRMCCCLFTVDLFIGWCCCGPRTYLFNISVT